MLQLRVNDMACGHCVKTITKAVTAIDAEASFEADGPCARNAHWSRRRRSDVPTPGASVTGRFAPGELSKGG